LIRGRGGDRGDVVISDMDGGTPVNTRKVDASEVFAS